MSDASGIADESGSASCLDPLGTFERLRDAYFRYYDTPFGLAEPVLQAERRALLDRDGGAWRPPLLELRPEYATAGRTLAESAAAAGAPAALGEFAACGLLPTDRQLYRHQEEALRAALEPGANMAITAGTGSGKTESFVLPVLSGLLAESESWGGAPAQPDRWWATGGPFQTQRDGETGHPAAVRALVLYPMNALVDDQLTRMRRALDSDAARQWLDTHRRGHRFFFGRYTGSTPVTGAPTNGLAVRNLRQYLTETERRHARARELANTVDGAEFFVPRLDGAEMRSRWDMQAAPPDVLITNYSMLNVMLHRGREAAFFDRTRQWLDSDPAHRFTLVVDELHMYRGTAGTEVAYLLRALFHRLGLRQRPEQLRVLAASASLDPQRDAGYLEQFFGIERGTFRFVPGILVEPPPTAAGATAADLAEAPPDEAAALARARGTVTELRRAFAAPGQPPGAVTAGQLAARLFPSADPDSASAATANLLAGLAAAPEAGDPKLRAHMFFRNIPGMWACSDPECGELADDERIPGPDGRRVGRLHAEPVTRCGCGARVLELLYCQTCGDVFLGGFATRGAAEQQQFRSILLPSVPDLARLPDQVRVDRNAANYVVYWPRPHGQLTELSRSSWTADGNTRSFAFRSSVLAPFSGELTNNRNGFTGWSFHAGSSRNTSGAWHHPLETLSPFPTLCPNCGDDWEIRYTRRGAVPFGDPLRERSPIRGMRTGFEKINQVLTTALACDMPPADRKAIIFTDSRQDAAKLSSGLALRHYQDLLRLLVYRQLQENHNPADDLTLARLHYTERAARTPATRAAAERLRGFDAAALDELRDLWDDEDPAATTKEEIVARRYGQGTTIRALCAAVGAQLLGMGVNPAGPAASLQHTEEKSPVPWSTLYDWETSPPQPKPAGRLGQTQLSLLAEIDDRLREECIDALFSGAGRDFESLGLGWIALTSDTGAPAEGANTSAGRVRAALRVLAGQRRFTDNRDPRPDAPPPLRKLWEEIDREGGPTPAESGQELAAANAAPGFLIDPNAVVIRPAGSQAWVCATCRRTHLTVGCGLCTKCRRQLPAPVELAKADTDYYSWRAVTRTGEFRLNSAELTGQTDRLDAQSRQSRFQNVFLGSPKEHRLPDGLDLLSVTTTMEAGVDIGALSAVVLGNMPPTRFNYQQRVGRAGRRDTPVAVALTVCRGRSHDEYYFDHPEAITNEPTPKPYLALEQEEIIRRALASAVLDAAFADLGPSLAESGFDLTANVHGAFGLVTDWAANTKPLLAAWFEHHADTVRELAAALATRTPHQSTSSELGEALAGSLVPSIDASIVGAGSDDLSQRLAERGILPMYGFPTSVRYLHLRRPQAAYPWPPAGVIDRDLPMAVAQFAPLSEVVRDGRVYEAVGVAAFEPSGTRAAPVSDPLGPSRHIGNCRNCSHVDPAVGAGPVGACPRCGADDGQYQQFELREPRGFRAARGRDFDGTFAFHPRALSTRAATDFDSLIEHRTPCYTVHSGPGDRYVINDNRGELFEFRPASDAAWGGYVSAEAIRANHLPASAAGTGDAKQVAIGAVQPTDLMFFGPTSPVLHSAGLRLNITGRAFQPDGAQDPADGRRAAWYSLAFLLRRAAAEKLDVNSLELAAGIYAGLADDQPATFAFLADTAENGAGFSTELGRQSEFPALVARVQRLVNELGRPGHANHCTSSCYRCLQDYSNMAYHSMLDWRLARDLLEVLTTQQLSADSAWEQRSAQQWARGLADEAKVIDGLPAAAVHFRYRNDTVLLVVRHTLEAAEQGLAAPRLLEARAAAASLGAGSVVFVDPFTLDRDPKRPLEMVRAGG